jgi:alpha-L-fucosidase 2
MKLLSSTIICMLFIYGPDQNLPAQETTSVSKICEQLILNFPENGFISAKPASRWEESLITGNGTIGALVRGNPGNDVIILSHEKLFMPEYPPTKAPDLKAHLEQIREFTLVGEGKKAAELAGKAGREAGIENLIWTDPLVPACQLEVKTENSEPVILQARMVNYETGEATSAWKTKSGVFHQTIFISRTEGVAIFKINSPDKAKLNFSFRLNQLPLPESEEEEFNVDDLISEVKTTISKTSMSYATIFKKQWPGSLKGYNVTAKLFPNGGDVRSAKEWVSVRNADEILIIFSIKLFYDLPVERNPQKIQVAPDYQKLLSSHTKIHKEMFNRFSLSLGLNDKEIQTSEEFLSGSSPGNLRNGLVEQLCKAARYELICSSGELPPSLQGIWGGTWRPAWSGDFTLNGNVPSAIACGLNCNFQEVTEAYMNYMLSMFDDFRDNARGLYGAPGIFVPSRTSSSGKTYHYLTSYPHLFWYAGAAWTSQFFYDYWQYTGDEEFLKKKTIPFMEASADFYEYILTKDKDGAYMFLPSYSPEVGPLGYHPVAINATMDIAALKQLLRNLTSLVNEGWVKTNKISTWKNILDNLPDYAVDNTGDLKEWIWPDFQNDNRHRHASHLYPLYYEVDPDFDNKPELKKAAITAIENRMKYRRSKNGAEMAFGLVQKGLAAAHINDTEHAYECVDWLCNSYWSPTFTAYHDPGRIFNADICGGLPAVVTEMIIQSSINEINLLPALPNEWRGGSIKGVRTRGGFVIALEWRDSIPVKVTVKSLLGKKSKLSFKNKVWDIDLTKGQSKTWNL